MISRRFPNLLVTLALLAPLGGCGLFYRGPYAPAEPVEANMPYIIGPGDSLSVFVYHNPELSSSGVAVRPDGRISLPLIPEMVATGKKPTDLAKDIEKRLKEFVKEPNVSVIVGGFVGPLDRQVRVIGEATDPISVPFRDQMTLLDLMVLTHGITRYAAGNRAIIIRQYGGKRQTFRVRLSDLIKDGDIDQNVALAPGDTLIIPQSFF